MGKIRSIWGENLISLPGTCTPSPGSIDQADAVVHLLHYAATGGVVEHVSQEHLLALLCRVLLVRGYGKHCWVCDCSPGQQALGHLPCELLSLPYKGCRCLPHLPSWKLRHPELHSLCRCTLCSRSRCSPWSGRTRPLQVLRRQVWYCLCVSWCR